MARNAKAKRRVLTFATCSVLVIAMGATAYLIRAHYLESRAKVKLAEGLACLEHHDYQTALTDIGVYLSRHQQDVPALYAYAQARQHVPELNNGQVSDTISILRRVVSLAPDHQGASDLLLTLYQQVGFDTEASQLAGAVLARYPADTTAMQAKAVALQRLRRFEQAAKASIAYNMAKPDDIMGQIMTLEILSQCANGQDRLQKRADDLHKAAPDDARFVILESLASQLGGDNAAARQWIQQAAALTPPDAACARLLVKQCELLGMFDQALGLLDRLSSQMRDPALSTDLACRLWQLGRYQDVMDRFPTATKDDPADLLAMRCLSLHSLGKLNDAAKAREVLDAAAAAHPEAAAWRAIIDQLYATGKPDYQTLIQACQSGLDHQPGNAYFHFFLARADMDIGESLAAVQAWQDAFAEAPAWSAPLLQLSDVAMQSGRVGEAIAAAQAACDRDPQSNDAQRALLSAQILQIRGGKQDAAPQLLANIDALQAKPGFEEGTFLPYRAQILVYTNQNSQASQVISAALNREKPLPADVLLRLVAVSREGGLGLEEQCLKVAQGAYGMTPAIAFAAAYQRLRDGHAQEGMSLLQAARSSPNAADDDKQWQLDWARYLDLADLPQAKQAWIDLADRYPTDASLQWAAISAKSIQGDQDFIGGVLDRLREQFGDRGMTWRLARASWLLRDPTEKRNAEAGLLLGDLTRSDPQLFAPHMLLANCYLNLGNTDGAIDQLTTAANLAPDATAIALELAKLLHQRGDYPQAKVYLDRVLNSGAASADERRGAALLTAAEGDPRRAVEVLESLPADQSTSVQSDPLLVLATLYHQIGDKAKLEAACDKLRQSDDPAAIEFVAEVYMAENRRPEAESVLKRLDAIKVAPDVKDVILGSQAARDGNYDQAVKYLREATTVAPSDLRAWKLLVLTELGQNHPDQAVQTTTAAAGRFPKETGFAALQRCEPQAVSLLPHWPVAINFLADLINSPEQEPAVMATFRALRQADADHSSPKQLAVTLSALADQHIRLMSLQLLAARTWLNAGDVDSAINLSTRAMQLFPSDPAPASLAAEALAMAGRWSEAMTAAQALRERSPDFQISADEMIASAQSRLGNLSDAYSQLEPYMSQAIADPDKFGNVLLQDAAIQIKMGHADDAARLLRPLLAKSSEARLDWIRLAGQSVSDPDQASQWLREVEPSLAPGDVKEHLELASAWESVAGRSTNKTYREKAAEKIKDFASHFSPQANESQLLLLASLQEQCGDASAAEASYRALLQADPKMRVADNNLAMLLAKSNHLNEALNFAQQAVQTDAPYRPDCLQTLAYVQDRLGQREQAMATLKTALATRPNHVPSLIALARIQVETGQKRQARETIQEIDQLIPDPSQLPGDLRDELQAVRLLVTQSS